jgi:dTDP-4-dehydrorhamnose reductase
MSRWLVTGANGQLGHDLMEILATAGHSAVGLDLPEIDITDPESVADALRTHQPDVVVNAAAYTAVDAAEEDEPTALQVNGVGPAVVAAAIAADPGLSATVLVQVSTDYVFDGTARSPYQEDATPNPASAYGRTKLVGEESVRLALPDRHYIVRTAWLYGAHGANFVKTMLRLEAAHETVKVVDDQYGQPTWSRDLARQIEMLVTAAAPAGVYHGTAGGATNWYGFTQRIFDLAGHDPERVLPTTTEAFPRPAPRPAYSVLGHERWAAVGVPSMRSWDEALGEALPGIRANL